MKLAAIVHQDREREAKSYQQGCYPKSKKRESALKGKENKPVACSKGLFACERPRGRVGIRKRLIEAAVEDALKAFCGKRRNPAFDRCPENDPCEERLWARFAWRFGWGLLQELTLQGVAEMAEHRKPMKDEDKPKVLQRLIGPFWRRRSGGTEAAAVGTRGGKKNNKRTTAREAV